MTRIVYTDDAEMGLSRQLCRGHLNCGLVIVAASSIKEEAFGRGATEDEHLGWAQRHSSYRIWSYEFDVLDLKLSPSVATYRITIVLSVALAWELGGWARVQVADEKWWICLALSIITWHQVNLLVVHDNTAGTTDGDRQAVNLEPMVSHCVISFAELGRLRFVLALPLAFLASKGQNESIMDES